MSFPRSPKVSGCILRKVCVHVDGPLPASLVRKAASLALSAAAIRARQLAEDERQAVQKLMVEAVNAQGELLELRMKTFTHLSKAVQEERSSLQASSNPKDVFLLQSILLNFSAR